MILASADTRTVDYALEQVQSIHKLSVFPEDPVVRRVYRPFWYAVVGFTGKREGQPVQGQIVCLGDARVPRFGTIGVFPHCLENAFDLRENGVNFMLTRIEPEEGSEVLEPLRDSADMSTLHKLRFLIKTIRRNLRINNVAFDANVKYDLIYRPYWEVSFLPGVKKERLKSLVCMDEVLLTAKNF